MKKFFLASACALAIAACSHTGEVDTLEEAASATQTTVDEVVEEASVKTEAASDVVEEIVEQTVAPAAPVTLAEALAAQSDEAKARYAARRPADTIEFLGLEPGMTVVEALPGGGWYSKILLPYLGGEGELIAGNYPDDIWARFGFGPEFEERAKKRTAEFVGKATEWAGEGGASVTSTTLTTFEGVEDESVDAVLFIRALHNLNRFSADAGYLDDVMASLMRSLKPGGLVGVVQHRAPADNPDEWADGSAGYLKQQAVIDAFTSAGFLFEASSELNANPEDKPGVDDIVWRLPPSLNGTEEGTPEQAAMIAIGESDRMTLRFRKPS